MLSGDHKKQEIRQQISQELADSLAVLERDLAKLKVERAMTLAEVEELSATKRYVRSSTEDCLSRMFSLPLCYPSSLYRHILIHVLSIVFPSHFQLISCR